MKVKLVEFRWTEDTGMDPYSRSGDEVEIQGAIFIPGNNCPNVLVFMSDKPIFRKMAEEKPGVGLGRELCIPLKEWDFVEIKEVEIDDDHVRAARVMADSKEFVDKTNSAFRAIFGLLAEVFDK